MKTLTILSLALCFLILMPACQPEEVATFQPGYGRPIDKAPHLPSTSIPPDEVERTNYNGATRWKITFTDPDPLLPYSMNYQSFFSIEDGATLSFSELNASAETTAQADMKFLYSLKATSEYENILYSNHPQIQLQYPEAARDTQFVPADFGLLELLSMTDDHPEQFQDAFENSPYWFTSYQPYNYNEDGDEPPSYQTGEIYLFKTDRNPVRYGAVRIVEKTITNLSSSQFIIEITVQADNTVGQKN